MAIRNNLNTVDTGGVVFSVRNVNTGLNGKYTTPLTFLALGTWHLLGTFALGGVASSGGIFDALHFISPIIATWAEY